MKTASEMTYTVSSGALNSTQTKTQTKAPKPLISFIYTAHAVTTQVDVCSEVVTIKIRLYYALVYNMQANFRP